MKKVVVGVSRALSPHPVGNAFEEQLFFTYDGLGRQTNAAIRATHACASAPAGASIKAISPLSLYHYFWRILTLKYNSF